MKRVEKFALALAIAYALKPLSAGLLVAWLPSFLQSAENGSSADSLRHIQLWLAAIGMVAESLLCAAWLHTEAKLRGYSRWVWALFGLTCRVTGIGVFYLWVLLIHSQSEGEVERCAPH